MSTKLKKQPSSKRVSFAQWTIKISCWDIHAVSL